MKLKNRVALAAVISLASSGCLPGTIWDWTVPKYAEKGSKKLNVPVISGARWNDHCVQEQAYRLATQLERFESGKAWLQDQLKAVKIITLADTEIDGTESYSQLKLVERQYPSGSFECPYSGYYVKNSRVWRTRLGDAVEIAKSSVTFTNGKLTIRPHGKMMEINQDVHLATGRGMLDFLSTLERDEVKRRMNEAQAAFPDCSTHERTPSADWAFSHEAYEYRDTTHYTDVKWLECGDFVDVDDVIAVVTGRYQLPPPSVRR